MNSVQEAMRLGQAVWLDYLRRAMLCSGELQRLISLGLSGVTVNPAALERAIVGSTDYDDELLALRRRRMGAREIYERLVAADVREAADVLRPIYDRTGGAHGYVSLEVDPALAYDTSHTFEEARRLFRLLDRPNVMVKVPATPEGIPAIRRLTGEGVNVHATLIFSLGAYERVRAAYIAGIEDLAESGVDPGSVTSVAAFSLSRIDTAVDRQIEDCARHDGSGLRDLTGKTALAAARLAYKALRDTFDGAGFAPLRDQGARIQRLLWTSTGPKSPAYPDLAYVEPLIGRDTISAMPPTLFNAFLDHGHVTRTLGEGLIEAEKTLTDLVLSGVSLEQSTSLLLEERVQAFIRTFDTLLAGIEEKKARLATRRSRIPATSIVRQKPAIEDALSIMEDERIVPRIWQKDYFVWKTSAAEITNRLGWLNITDRMRSQIPALAEFTREVREAGFRHAVLLGMGGSSLGAEVMRQVLGNKAVRPGLAVLDSTVPDAVRAVADAIEPARTLFVVSSKSGTTIETMTLFSYFREMVRSAVGEKAAGRNFAAITDPGTPLVDIAARERFRRVFLNSPDIGGRYSMLSYFGLVPAALAGVDLTTLLERADIAREGCVPAVPVNENQGAWLGAYLGQLAIEGQDKLTLITSPALASFGLWVEQLIAESTGKEGKGIVPVTGEPLVAPEHYGSDRIFVYERLDGDDNTALDLAVRGLQAEGYPVAVHRLRDRYDLGGEFYCWEFATAVAGAFLRINPFNQPDVQRTKRVTERLLSEYEKTGRPPRVESQGSLEELLERAGAGKYFNIMAYLRQTPETDAVFADFRQKLVEEHGIATTLGYGPRFLHSTGQLHKGGASNGLFLQITSGHDPDLPVPGQPYSFGTIVDAQAAADLEALESQQRSVASIRLSRGEVETLRDILVGTYRVQRLP